MLCCFCVVVVLPCLSHEVIVRIYTTAEIIPVGDSCLYIYVLSIYIYVHVHGCMSCVCTHIHASTYTCVHLCI